MVQVWKTMVPVLACFMILAVLDAAEAQSPSYYDQLGDLFGVASSKQPLGPGKAILPNIYSVVSGNLRYFGYVQMDVVTKFIILAGLDKVAMPLDCKSKKEGEWNSTECAFEMSNVTLEMVYDFQPTFYNLTAYSDMKEDFYSVAVPKNAKKSISGKFNVIRRIKDYPGNIPIVERVTMSPANFTFKETRDIFAELIQDKAFADFGSSSKFMEFLPYTMMRSFQRTMDLSGYFG